MWREGRACRLVGRKVLLSSRCGKQDGVFLKKARAPAFSRAAAACSEVPRRVISHQHLRVCSSTVHSTRMRTVSIAAGVDGKHVDYTHTIKYDSAMKRNETLPFASQ